MGTLAGGGKAEASERRPASRSTFVTGILLGVSLMGALDTIAFHQLLQWHNFYVHTTSYWRIFSDGLLHLGTTTLLFLGALRLWGDRRLLAKVDGWKVLAAGLLFGMGGFQLYDGIIHHKSFRSILYVRARQINYPMTLHGMHSQSCCWWPDG
jgi:uncharacterized membrane protein